MAKTIEQLANDYALHYEADDDVAYRGYVAGANSVLEEVEKQIEQVKYYSDTSASSMLYKNLVKTIKELKG